MKKRYDTIVLGATYYGLGYASSHPDCLVLEEFQTVGGDFHHSLHPARMDAGAERAADTELGRLMRQYGVWTETGFDLLKVSPVAREFAARKMEGGMGILLDAHVISVEKCEADVIVTFITNEGIQSVKGSHLVDATVDCISAPSAVRRTAKSLNVFTVCMGPDLEAKLMAVCPGCEVTDGSNENEKLIQFPVPVDEPMTKAYQNMMEIWKEAFPGHEEKILFVADDFDAAYERIGAEGTDWVGGLASNPMEAFLKGAEAR